MSKDVYSLFAFISYSHRDMAVAKWLQRRLEGFRLPTEVHNHIDARCRYLRPVFRDQSDLNTGILGDELRRHLDGSKYLILLCSASSAQSAWVSDEARAFVEAGRLDHIIPVIIPDGATPERELFPAYLRCYFEANPSLELLGVNIGEVGKEKALVRVVSRMLGVSFDSLWKRHQRRRRIRLAAASLTIAVALTLTYLFAIPVRLDVAVNAQESSLPTGEETIVTIDGAEFRQPTASREPAIVSLPGYKRFGEVDIRVSSQFFTPVDTLVSTGYGVTRSVAVELRRDSTFATYGGTVYDTEMNPLEGVEVTVGGRSALTDGSGRFAVTLPLSEQRTELPVTLSKPGYTTVSRDDETPGTNIKYMMHGSR